MTFSTTLVAFLLIFPGRKPGATLSNISGTQSPPLIFAGQPPNAFIFDQQNLSLTCSIESSSLSVSYTWFRGDQELPGSMVNGQGSLNVPNITEGEFANREGVDYYCIASGNIGFDVAVRSRTITVFSTYFDGFAGSEQNAVKVVSIPVALNSDVALECDVFDANPPPQIKWYNDQGAIQEIWQGNNVRFLDGGRYLYLRRLQRSHLERQYYCAVTNVNLIQEISAPTRYVLTDNLTHGILIDYKQIGDLTAFVGNRSFEFAYVGGVFDNVSNRTANTLTVNGTDVAIRGNVGIIESLPLPGVTTLEATVRYSGFSTLRYGTLIVNQIPRIIKNTPGVQKHFTVEKNLIFTCEFEGFPLPRNTFYYNGRPVSSDIGMTVTGNTLTIPTPQVSHSGIYQCIVSNDFGDDQAAWLLEIRKPLIPQVQPHNLTELDAFDDHDLGALIVRDNGSIVSFSVNVVADPCPDVVWSLNGSRLVPSSESVAMSYNNPCAETSTIRPYWTFTLNVSLTAATSGSYTANFTNMAGSAQSSAAYFTIPEPISVTGTGLTLNETCLKEDSTVSLRCTIRGFPRPSIEFHRNNIHIDPESAKFHDYVLKYYDELVIVNVTMTAGGMYMCTATSTSNLQPSQVRAQQQFDFCTEPVIISIAATPTDPQLEDMFSIECVTDGTPMPAVVWFKDGVVLNETNDDSVQIVSILARKTSRVDVPKASSNHNGEYTCVASNDAGSTSASIPIKISGYTLRALSIICKGCIIPLAILYMI